MPVLLLAAGVALAVLAIRLLWVAWRTESGWDTLSVHWRNATLGPFGGEHQPVQNRPLEEQARFWLAEAERIVGENPGSAELAMGAAWVLDAPGGFSYYDDRSKRAAEDAFEAACRESCLQLARRATELEPENRDWWRMRALLTFRSSYFDRDLQPRAANWAAVLAEASRHDPDNALYDYLAALQYWRAGGRRERENRRDQIEVLDADEFQRGDEHFARAVARPILSTGEWSLRTVADFLSRSSLSRHDQAEVAARRLLDLRRDRLIDELRRWQRARSAELESRGVHEALNAWYEFLRIPEQVEAADEPGIPLGFQFARWTALLEIRRLAEEHPGTVPDMEFQSITDQIASARRRTDALIDAFEAPTFPEVLPALVAPPRLNAAVPLLATGVVCLLLGVRLSRRRAGQPIAVGPFAHLCAFGTGFAAAAGIAAALAADAYLPDRPDWLFALDGDSYWTRFAIRWITLPGYVLGAGLSLLLLGLCYIVRATDNDPRKCLRLVRSEPAPLLGGLLVCLSRAALALGGCLLLMYLLAAPAAVRLAETTWQQTIAPIRDPEAYWSSVELKVAEIERNRMSNPPRPD